VYLLPIFSTQGNQFFLQNRKGLAPWRDDIELTLHLFPVCCEVGLKGGVGSESNLNFRELIDVFLARVACTECFARGYVFRLRAQQNLVCKLR
jgi:hypothetical protein